MLVIWTILVLLLSFLTWLLFAPIRLRIDSSNNEYLIDWVSIGSIALIPANQEWFFYLKIGFWKKKFFVSNLIERALKRERKKIEPKKKKKRKATGFSRPLGKATQVLKTFRIKVCKIDFDTDDYFWNALLTPAFQIMNSQSQHQIAVNFKGINKVILTIENRLIKIIYSIFAKK